MRGIAQGSLHGDKARKRRSRLWSGRQETRRSVLDREGVLRPTSGPSGKNRHEQKDRAGEQGKSRRNQAESGNERRFGLSRVGHRCERVASLSPGSAPKHKEACRALPRGSAIFLERKFCPILGQTQRWACDHGYTDESPLPSGNRERKNEGGMISRFCVRLREPRPAVPGDWRRERGPRARRCRSPYRWHGRGRRRD